MSTYPTDLNDQQWEAVRHCIPPSRPVGVARQVSLRDVVNAIRYRRRSGCAWRLLPHEFPHWRTVYGYDRQWQRDGTWRQMEPALRQLRTDAPTPIPAAHLLDNPSPLAGDTASAPLG